MERVQKIWEHPLYQQCLASIRRLEENREFCRHTPEHFLDVARLTWILCQEEQIDVPRPIVYAAGLLHDIGRFRQYQEGIPHDEASAALARQILPECGFDARETEQIVEMILAHRHEGNPTLLYALFYRADKLSRSCFLCASRDRCNWPEEKKNLTIRY